MIDIAPPPAIYLPYNGPLARFVTSLDRVNRICRALGMRTARTIYGCATWGDGACLQIIADIPERRQIEMHEDAHCNGWNHEPP